MWATCVCYVPKYWQHHTQIKAIETWAAEYFDIKPTATVEQQQKRNIYTPTDWVCEHLFRIFRECVSDCFLVALNFHAKKEKPINMSSLACVSIYSFVTQSLERSRVSAATSCHQLHSKLFNGKWCAIGFYCNYYSRPSNVSFLASGIPWAHFQSDSLCILKIRWVFFSLYAQNWQLMKTVKPVRRGVEKNECLSHSHQIEHQSNGCLQVHLFKVTN